MKNLILFFVCFFVILNTSVAKCDEEKTLKLVEFPPSRLAVYLPKASIVEKDVYNYHDGYSARYNIIYKDKPIILIVENNHLIDLADVQGNPYETIKLTNISNTAELKKWVCDDKICSHSLFRSGSIVSASYNTTISYMLPMSQVHIGEKFMKSLFINDYKCIATEPDSIINHGPFKIDIKFDSNSVTVLPQYYANIANFAKFINESDANVNIEGHTDRTEASTVSGANYEANLALSLKRAKAVRTLLIIKFGVDEDKIRETEGNAYYRPLADNNTEDGRQENRRVQAYVYGD